MSNMITFAPNQTLGMDIIRRGICGYCWMLSTKKGVLEFERHIRDVLAITDRPHMAIPLP
jgi:hypothetical protein